MGTGATLNSLEGLQGGQFSPAASAALWVHPGPSGRRREMCEEEPHVASSFAAARATSPGPAGAQHCPAPCHLPLPLSCSGFLLCVFTYFPFLLQTPCGGCVGSYTTFCMFQVGLFEMWRLPSDPRSFTQVSPRSSYPSLHLLKKSLHLQPVSIVNTLK